MEEIKALEVTIPDDKVPVSMRVLTRDQINEKLETGLEDIRAGRTVPAAEAFEKMRNSV